MSKCALKVGFSYFGMYPRYNYSGLPNRHEGRRFKVLSITDTLSDPVPMEWININPTLQRSRWLARCWDYDKQAERSFYAGSFLDLRELSPDEQSELLPCSARYLVIDRGEVQFESPNKLDARVWMRRARGGVLCKVLCCEITDFTRRKQARTKTA